MLVIDLIELVTGNCLEKVRELDSADTAKLEYNMDALDERVKIWHLGEDVVAENEVSLHTSQIPRSLHAKKLDQCPDSPLFGGTGNVCCRINAEDRNAFPDKELQQIAIIAANLDNLARGPKVEPFGDRVDVLPSVLEPCIGKRRKIGILRKDMPGRDIFLQLYKKALSADKGSERIKRLHSVELVLCEIALTKRRHAEVDKVVKRTPAETTV
jgi:hypothetical protein